MMYSSAMIDNSKKYFWLIITFFVGALIWFIPEPEGVNKQAWHLFACFVATIFGIIVHPLPMACMAFLGLGAVVLTGVLPIQTALSGFSQDVIWLIVFAFFIARGFIKTGIGSRIAYFFLEFLGSKTLGLGYGIVATEVILAPAIPSSTARSGGVILPIVESMAKIFDSKPHHPSTNKAAAFITKVAFHSNVITSAMFLTAMAGNPIITMMALKVGVKITWGRWLLFTIVPGLISLILAPLFLYKLAPPEIKFTPNATSYAKARLLEMGNLQKKEWIMLGTFFLLVTLWILGDSLSLKPVVTALLGLIILLLTDVLNWKDIRKEEGAWETLIWFSVLLMMTAQLTELGFIGWFNQWISSKFQGLPWTFGFVGLVLTYFYSHYFFTSNIAHIGAMYPTFLTIAIAIGVPPYFAAMVLAIVSSLFGCLTHYGSGPAAALFGAGFVEVGSWLRTGFLMALFHLFIWSSVGMLWWKVLKLY